MNALSQVDGPGAAVELAAEAAWVLNHLPRLAVGWDTWMGDIGDNFRVIAEVRVAVERLAQAIEQVAPHVQRAVHEASYRSDSLAESNPRAPGVQLCGGNRCGRGLSRERCN